MKPRDTEGAPMSMQEIIAKFQVEEADRRAADPEYRQKEERREAERDAREAASRRAEWRSRMIACGVPDRAVDALEVRQETEAWRVVDNWIKSKKDTLVLSGGVGCGKTVAAAHAIDKIYGSMIPALAFVRAGIFGDEAEELRRKAIGGDVLVIDDLGVEPLDPKGYGQAALYDVIDTRHGKKLKTIMTTNLEAAAFIARYCEGAGERLRDRLREDGGFVRVAGESMRKNK